MKKGRNILWLVLTLAVCGLAAELGLRTGEPECLGHPVSYWTEPWHHHGQETPEREAAAFAQMDEDTVRWLAGQLDWKPSRLRETTARFLNQFGDIMSTRDHDGGRRESSIRALTRLGPRARTALPALESASQTTVELHNPDIRGQALGALLRIRGETVAPYVERLKTSSGTDWAILCHALAAQGSNAASAAPILAEALMRTNSGVWLVPTIAALGSIRSHPEVSVPALVHCLNITNRIERQVTLDALAKFGPQAASAKPALQGCLATADQFETMALQRVLKQIAPEATEPLRL